MSDYFFLITLTCPQCKVENQYHDMPNIVCDFCVADIIINGELQI